MSVKQLLLFSGIAILVLGIMYFAFFGSKDKAQKAASVVAAQQVASGGGANSTSSSKPPSSSPALPIEITGTSPIGKTARANMNNVSVYNGGGVSVRKVIQKGDWAGKVIGEKGSAYTLEFVAAIPGVVSAGIFGPSVTGAKPAEIGWVTKAQVNIS